MDTRQSHDFSSTRDDIVSRQVEKMVEAHARGEPLPVETFLAQHPELVEGDVVRLIYEEACLRQEAGEEGVSSEVLRRFPQWHAQLAVLLDCNRVLREAPRPELPAVGDELGDFRLLVELGRGAMGKTFLASQRSLAHRRVVLKVTPLHHEEHLSLARLQHMHIVPLYFEQEFLDRGVRVLGMPDLGGTSLAHVLDAMADVSFVERTGAQIVEVLDRVAAAHPRDLPSSVPVRKFLTRATYVDAVCWIGACLAEALEYAHDRGLVHFDIKPSNVLIACDGQPMLLDFHLARGPVVPGHPEIDRLGGTPEYLSPEQRAAMEAIRHGDAVEIAVDGRSDIYSLGLLIHEALGGDIGDGSSRSRRPLKRCNPRVTSGLSDIIGRCLAANPEQRYPDAGSLAADLRRHLKDMPLRGVPNQSLWERWRKWRRRRPAALASAVLWTAAVGTVVWFVTTALQRDYQSARQVETAISVGRDLLASRSYLEASAVLERGRPAAARLPQGDPRVRELEQTLGQVRRARLAFELSEVVRRLRFLFGVVPPSPEAAEPLYRRGLVVWSASKLITQGEGKALDAESGRQVRADLVDLATILAELRVQSAPADADGKAAALGEAVELLRGAEARLGPNPAISRDLRTYATRLGLKDVPTGVVPPPKTASEHYDLGRSLLRSGEYALADEELRRSTALQPGEFWPYYYRAVCSHRLQRYVEAESLFGVCVALEPRKAGCYFNRAVAAQDASHVEQARSDYSRALELDPSLSAAALNRGILSLREGRLSEALDDFTRARGSATTSGERGLIEFNLALVHLERKNTVAARASLERAAAHGEAAARALLGRLGRE